MVNPALRVLFVVLGAQRAPSGEQMAAVRSDVARVVGAALAATVVHAPCTHHYGQGRCVSDAETCDPDTAAESHALYREVYPQWSGDYRLLFPPPCTGPRAT